MGQRRESAHSLKLLHDAIVYIDSVTVSELFVLTVERPSQQAISTVHRPPSTVPSAAPRENRLVRQGTNPLRSWRGLFLSSLCRVACAFDMRIKG